MTLADFIKLAQLGRIAEGIAAGAVDLQGWNSKHAIFASAIAELKPRAIIEVGTWKGASAIHMAEVASRHGLDFNILCIDTWLGGDRAYIEHDFLADTLPVGGQLPLLQTFLRNITSLGLQTRVFAMPSTSADAAESLRHLQVMADLIYIDGGHLEHEVFRDLKDYWPLLRPGGALIGDDYVAENWPGVVQAANRFAARRGLAIEDHGGKFVIRKPQDFTRT